MIRGVGDRVRIVRDARRRRPGPSRTARQHLSEEEGGDVVRPLIKVPEQAGVLEPSNCSMKFGCSESRVDPREAIKVACGEGARQRDDQKFGFALIFTTEIPYER